MRVVQINITYGHGSTGIIARLIADMLTANGDESFVAYDGYNNYQVGNDYPIGNKWFYRLHSHLFTKLLDKEGFGSYIPTKGLCCWLDRIQPDVIHLHNIHGSYINLPVLFDYINDHHIPVVMTLHDCWTMTGHCYHFDAVGCDKWKTGCFECPLHCKYPVSVGPDNSRCNYKRKKRIFTSLNNAHVVSVSHFIDDVVSQSYLNCFPHSVIYNGINIDVFKPKETDLRSELGIAKDRIILLGVSSGWSDDKGLAEMIWLSKDQRFQVILIGVQSNLRGMLPSNIFAIGRTESQDQLAEYYSIADCFVNPTYNDSFPTVNIEALGCGTPIATYRTGGSPEAIDENTGAVVEREDKEALKDAVLKLVSSNRDIIRTYCRNRAELLFDQNNCYRDYLGIYNEIILTKQ